MYIIAMENKKSLEAGHAHIDDDRYDSVDRGAAGQPTMDLSIQLCGCSIASKYAIRLRSLMCLYRIAMEHNGQLEAAHAHIDDDRFNKVNCQPTLDLSIQL